MTQLGKKFVRTLKPKKDPTRELKFVEEAIELVKSSHNLLPSNVQNVDVEEVLDKLNAGSVLEPEQLLRLADAITVTKILKERLERLSDQFTMKELTQAVEPAMDVVSEIHRCIDPNGLIKDEASEKLREIRQQIRNSLEEVKRRSDAFIKMNRMFLQDPICVLKDGRHVFPIKASHERAGQRHSARCFRFVRHLLRRAG